MNRLYVDLQARALQALPSWLQGPAHGLRVAPSYFRWIWSTAGRQHASRILAPMRQRYRGCRTVVIGNGPSLNRMDLSVLKDEFTFGLNRIYLMFEEMGFATTFLVSINRFVIEQFSAEMLETPGLKILSWRHGRSLVPRDDVVCLTARPFGSMDGDVLRGYFNGGGTVTNVALELAYFMGFSEVLLVGVDHRYSQQGVPGKPIRSGEADSDHFSPDYFGRGVVWQLPNFPAMERGYRRADELFKFDGRRVYDGTVDGELKVFEKVECYKYLERSGFMNRAEWERRHGS